MSVYDDSAQTEGLQESDSPPVTAASNARASSVLSSSHEDSKKRLDLLAKMFGEKKSLPVAPAPVQYDDRAKDLARSSVAFSCCSRSDAHSVPHDAVPVPQTPVIATASQLAVPVTGNTDKSFDLGNIPFAMSTSAKTTPFPLRTEATLASSTSLSRPSSHKKSKELSRTTSGRSGRPRRSTSKRSPRSHAPMIVAATTSSAVSQSVSRSSSAGIAELLLPEPPSRPFPWKTIKVSEAKKVCTAQQLQKLVLDSMREYSSASSNQPGLLLEGFESIPLELEQSGLRLAEVEQELLKELVGREMLLGKHVACLKGFNGDQGARFAESLVVAITRSDRLAQEARMLREHVGKVEKLREGHWRAVSWE